MWELSLKHCCKTCVYSMQYSYHMETNALKKHSGDYSESELFPFGQSLLCHYCLENLGEESVLAVLVRPDGRCSGYECDNARFQAIHGLAPLEEEEIYGFGAFEEYCAPNAHVFEPAQLGF